MMNRKRIGWLTSMAVIVGCANALTAAPTTQPATTQAIVSPLEFRLVAEAPTTEPSHEMADPNGQGKLRVLDRVVLDASDVERAEAVNQNGWGLSLKMTARGSARMREVTGKNIGRRLAIIVNGRIISAPTIRSQLGSAAMISGRFTKEEVEAMTKSINAASGAGAI